MSHSVVVSALDPPPSIVPSAPGEGARLMAAVAQFETSLGELPGALFQLSEAELGVLVGSLLRMSGRAQNVAALVTADAFDRGTVTNSTATGALGWVEANAHGVDPAVARRVGAVGRECANPGNTVVAHALAAGMASVPAAAVAFREVPKVLRLLPTAGREEMLLTYLSLTRFGPRALSELSTQIVGRFAPEQLVRNEEIQQRCESVHWFDLDNGLTRIVAELSAAHAASVKHALQALSAPAPQPCADPWAAAKSDDADHDNDAPALETWPDAPEMDLRTPAKRRADALMQLVQTAAGIIDGTSSRSPGEISGTTKLIVTLDYNTLHAALDDAGKLPTYLPGVGRTTDGDYLDAGTLRRLACDADIIPIVLGGESEPLDVGRAKRLFTGGLRTAIIHRDTGCTFPDCDRPPDWCDAHHVDPWWTGGQTTLSNAALLCARHHSIVHRDLLTAHVTSAAVVWNMTPGLMPQRPGHGQEHAA